MADFDDNDFDIDELLDEIDSSGTKVTKGKAGDTGSGTGGGSSSEKRNLGGGAANKSVRFSDDKFTDGNDGSGDDFMSKLPRSQRDPPPSNLRTMFFSDSKSQPQSSTSSTNASTKPPLPPTSSAGRSGRSGAAGSASSMKDDWLGIQDGMGSLSPSGSPPTSLPIPRRSGTGPAIPPSSEPGMAKSTGNSSEEEDALFNDIGLARQTGGRRPGAKPGVTEQPQVKPTATSQSQQQKSGFGHEQNPISFGNDMLPPKPTFSSSFLDQLGMSPPPSAGGAPSSDMKSVPPLIPKHQPLPSTASLLGTIQPMTTAPSVFPPEPPLSLPPKVPSAEAFQGFSLAAPPAPSASQQQVIGKKKALKKDGANSISTSFSTLQLPSHLINEDELKAMSSSLKTLYSNQLEMLEKSYREQMVFLSEANRRKEDLLKEEMKGMQADYEERLERLRNEVRDMEDRHSHKDSAGHHQDITALATLAEQLNASVVTARDVLQKSKEIGATTTGFPEQALELFERKIEHILLDNLGRNKENQGAADEKLIGMVRSIDDSVGKRFNLMNDAWRNLLAQVKQNMSEVVETSASNANRQSNKALEQEVAKSEKKILGQVETLGKVIKGKEDVSPKILSKLEDSEKIFLIELAKLHKLQRKTKDSTDAITLEPLVKLLESDREDEQRRRERLGLHLKEMRRDLKRILLENEGRQESTQKFNMSTEIELKSISQSIRDLNSQLKFSLISGPSHPENLTNQFNSSMQQTQAEMEMKLLREERQALSESMAQINVEKRKLSEDKVDLEKKKLDFNKERDQLRNLELQLKTRLEETEELQKKTESVRREEIHLTSEAQVKMRELEREKSTLREKLMEADQRLRGWEQKLRQEKVELMRERELVDRLREQLLCPGCLKTNDHIGVIHPPPPPYIPIESSISTNALTGSMMNMNTVAHEYFNSRLNSSGDGGGETNSDDLYETYYRKLFD